MDTNILSKKNLDYWVSCGILRYDELVPSESEVLMIKILDNVHKHPITQLPDGRWYTYVPDPTKASGQKQVKRKDKEKLLAVLLKDYGLLPDCASKKTVREVFLEWIEYKQEFTKATYKPLSPSTIKRYKRDYKRFLENSDLCKAPISLDDIALESYLIQIVKSSEMIPAAFGNLFGYINQMFKYAVRKRYIVTDPMTFIDKKRIMSFCCAVPPKKDSERTISFEDLQKFIQSVNDHLAKYPNYMPDYAILLGLLTGMRIGEIVAVPWKCVDDDFIHIDYSEHRLEYDDYSEIAIGGPKSQKYRLVPITKDISDLLDMVRKYSVDETWVFADENGRITENAVSSAIRRRSIEAGIKRTSIHEIRRTISSYLNTLLPREAVANMLGHLPTTNERFYDYDISSRTVKVEALEKFSDNVVNFPTHTQDDKVRKAR